MPEFVVVGESEADTRMTCELADRVFYEDGPEWVREQEQTWFISRVLPGMRTWAGMKPGTPFTRWAEIPALGKAFPKLSFLTRPEGRKQKPDYAAARKAILLTALLRKDKLPDALILVRDLDHQEERREGLAEAREDEAGGPFIVIPATPNPKREAWVLNGFVCDDEREGQKLESLRQKLGFDPCLAAERLRYSSGTSQPERDPKRILGRLTGGDFNREQRCWAETTLAILRERGEKTYLKEFLDEVKGPLLLLLYRS